MDKQDLILQKLDEINERLDAIAIAPFVKVKKKKKPESGRRDYTMGFDFLPSLKRGDSFCKTVKPHRKP